MASQGLQDAWKATAIPAIPTAGSYTESLRQISKTISCAALPAPTQPCPATVPVASQSALSLPEQSAAPQPMPAASAWPSQASSTINQPADEQMPDYSRSSISLLETAPSSLSGDRQLAVHGQLLLVHDCLSGLVFFTSIWHAFHAKIMCFLLFCVRAAFQRATLAKASSHPSTRQLLMKWLQSMLAQTTLK